MVAVEYKVSGMSCSHCEAAIRAEVGEVPGVVDMDVSAASGRLIVTGEHVDDFAVIAAVDEAGYQASRS